MWPFKNNGPKDGDLRVVSKIGDGGKLIYCVQRYEEWPLKMWRHQYCYDSKREACERMRNILRAREYGVKVEDCNCEGEG